MEFQGRIPYAPIPGVLVLGIGHKAHHGKDTCAQAMVESAPADVLRIGFADALYDYCRIEFGMKTKDAYLLQKVGTNLRAENPQVWIDAVYWKIVEKKPKVVVISDLRHLNEAQFIKDLRGYTIKVERLVGETPYQAGDRDPNHVSEVQLDGYSFDLTITNRDLLSTRRNAVVALNFYRQIHENDPMTILEGINV